MNFKAISIIYLLLSQLVLAPEPEFLPLKQNSETQSLSISDSSTDTLPRWRGPGGGILKTKPADNYNMVDKTKDQDSLQLYSYPADIQSGIIGTDEAHPIDDPYDNVFHINLPVAPKIGDQIWLTYRLKGVKDHTALARSINDQTSVGGYLVQKHDHWSIQKEFIAPSSLRKGDNVIRFRTPVESEYIVEIKDLQLLVIPGGDSPSKASREITLNLPNPQYYENQVYLKGFLSGQDRAFACLYANNQPIELNEGIFETILKKPAHIREEWKLVLTATFPDGESIQHRLILGKGPAADFIHPMLPKGNTSAQWFENNRAGQFQIEDAAISVPEQGLGKDAFLSITPLREIDLPPMHPELVNVTKNRGGFRFLPDGLTFNLAAELQLDYDPELIPKGYSAREIQTFYFDEQDRKWKAVPKDSLLESEQRMLAMTTHFTDFINGIIKVPESPQTQGYTPTSIKDLEAADPATGIVQITPPSANNMGTANLNFPLKLPQGRRGIQPHLAIDYNSGSINSWLGVGWNLHLPSIGIETRWGVPRFSATQETETYHFGGDQLFPVAHRGSLKPRSGPDKIFHPRVEGAFQKIIRHGNNPKGYWWEVIDKNGSRKFFGGLPGQGLLDQAILKDRNGNIAHWGLVEIRDLDENFVRFHYNIVKDPGLPNGSVPGQQIYPDYITYTGHGNTEGKYSVHFIRDRQLSEAKRPDVEIDARLGFKQVTADLLRKVEVRFKGNTIRSYELKYQQGAFFKSLLTSISEFDKEGEEFYKNEFEYFDDVRQSGVYQPYRENESLQVPDDQILGPIVSPLPWANGETSVLGGSKSNSLSAGLAVTVGPLGNLFAKTNTVGGNYAYAESSSEGLISFVDISGDGLPDKVYSKPNKGLFYRKNLGVTDENSSLFGEEFPLNMNRFEQSKTVSNSVGAEAHPGIFFVGYTYTDAKTNTNVYFVDLNGDGLIDIANNGKGYFSFITENGSGTPRFSTKSSDTPSPIIEGNLSDVAPPPPSAATLDSLIDQFPLHDMVRMWEAPCDGTINIFAPVQLIESTTPEAETYLKNDGVTVSIQFQDVVLWKENIAPDNFQPINPPQNSVSNLTVRKGDQLYFRLQSIKDGAYDQVLWDPEINYTTIDSNYVDPNNKRVFHYKASEDFVLASRQMASMPVTGAIKVQGRFQKPITSDDLTLEALKNGAVIWNKHFAWNETADEVIDLDGQSVPGSRRGRDSIPGILCYEYRLGTTEVDT